MKLSKRETAIIKFLQQEPSKEADAENLWPLFWLSIEARPKAWRACICKSMLLLCAKTQIGPERVRRSSALGPGILAIYSIEESE